MSLARKSTSFHMFYTLNCLQGLSAPHTKDRFEIGRVLEELDRYEKTHYGGT